MSEKLYIDIISGKSNAPFSVSPNLYGLEQGSGKIWRPLIGKDLNIFFSLSRKQAGRVQMVWSWFDLAGSYPSVKVDGRPWLIKFGGFIALGPGRHQVSMNFTQVRQPLIGGDPRPIAVAFTRLEVVGAPPPTTSFGEWLLFVALLPIFLIITWRILFK